MTPHNNANLGDIAENVLMPGDPLRAKYIAENFLTDYKLVNTVRNMFAYTGNYKGKKLTVFSSGMGMPSMGIYSYELFKFYNVNNIIRIGTCGAYSPKLNLLDTILVDNSFTIGNFAKALNNDDCHLVHSSDKINNKIQEVGISLGYNLKKIEPNNSQKTLNNNNDNNNNNNSQNSHPENSSIIRNNNTIYIGNTVCSEVFDYYADDFQKFISVFPKYLNIIAAEMEAFALFYTAKYFNRDASCLLSVVDSRFKNQEISAQDRETSLNNMIKIALETAIQLD